MRTAVLADSAAQYLTPLLKTLFFKHDIAAEIYEGEYDAIRQEAFAPGSRLYAFKPEIVFILNATQGLRAAYSRHEGGLEAFAASVVDDAVRVWEAVKRHGGATVVQSTFAPPFERPFGNFGPKAAASFPAAVREINRRLADAARADAGVLINDVEFVSSSLGLRRWYDEKLWILCKAFCAFDCLPEVAQNMVDVARAAKGSAVKCVVVDLDNTLWGGVIGDDGVEGIRLGHLGEGEAFVAFQRFLLGLKRRGIALAVCSRNEPKTARLPFREHPDMVLKESDLAVFIANWSSKADNIGAIRETLGIGLDSIVFIDDDPFERNLVRGRLPEVIVPEMPEDAADFVKHLSELNLFETAAYSEEDRRRAQMYREQSERHAARAAFASTEEYLRSLNMRLTLARFDAFHLPRIVQLEGRSNQFNLTTKRYGEPDCRRFMEDEAGTFPLYASLVDDLGDSGLIAAAVLRYHGETLEVDSWLMSCRVLLRGVEEAMMNWVAAFAARKGFKTLRGAYVPTAKNAMVHDFYARFGFRKTADGPGGAAVWELETADYVPRPVHFAEVVAP